MMLTKVIDLVKFFFFISIGKELKVVLSHFVRDLDHFLLKSLESHVKP